MAELSSHVRLKICSFFFIFFKNFGSNTEQNQLITTFSRQCLGDGGMSLLGGMFIPGWNGSIIPEANKKVSLIAEGMN